jgi:hypothetical protein
VKAIKSNPGIRYFISGSIEKENVITGNKNNKFTIISK